MVAQYPYLLQRLAISAVSSQDSSGDFVNSGSQSWIDVCKCRDEDGRQKKISKSDGTFFISTHLIQCPFGVEPIAANQQIRVIDSNETVRLTGQVLYSEKGQLHTRIWV